MGDLETTNTNESKGTLNPSNESGGTLNPSNESESTLNPPNNTNNSSKKGVGIWIDKNMTPYVVERCADTILLVMNKIFIAPYDVALELLDIIRNRKYSKYIVGFWSTIGITALVFSIILFVLTDDFPLNAWSLGIVIASLTVILLGKHPVKIDVTTNLTKEIEESIEALNNKPIVNDSVSEEEEEEEELIFDDDDEEEEEDLDDDDDEEEEDLDDAVEEKDLDDDAEENLDDSLSAFLDAFDNTGESFDSSFEDDEDEDKDEDELNNFLDTLSKEKYSKVNPGEFFDSVNSNNKDIL